MAQAAAKSENRSGTGLVRVIIAGLLIAAISIGYFYYLSNRQRSEEHREEVAEASVLAGLLSKNMENDYPPSPKAVVTYFAELEQCLYNEKLSPEELSLLAERMRYMFDDALKEVNSQEQLESQLRNEIAVKDSGNISIFAFKVSASVDVFYFKKDGYECSRLYCTYMERVGTQMVNSRSVYVLRKDQDGHWKIYGWQPVHDDETPETQSAGTQPPGVQPAVVQPVVVEPVVPPVGLPDAGEPNG
ncbi:MAG: hypothetical protein IJT00_01670 [Lachnospiraceae bacterium]|nr:hypothetical protein [Lachnospiraceae bacterium]